MKNIEMYIVLLKLHRDKITFDFINENSIIH